MNTVMKRREMVEKISFLEKMAYGFGTVGSGFCQVLSLTYINFFYTDALGLNAAIVATIIMISKIADGFSDVLVGYLVDQTKSKYGKARAWLLRMAVPNGICLFLTFTVPSGNGVLPYVYVAVTYNLINTICYTLLDVPYGTLNSLMSRDVNQRMVINTFRVTMAQLVAMFTTMCTIPFINLAGGTTKRSAWMLAAGMYGVVAALSTLFCFAKTRERVVVVSEDRQKRVSLLQSVSLALKNKYWILLVFTMLFVVLGAMIPSTVSTYYMKYILGNENIVGVINSITYIPALMFNPFMPLITKKIGKRNAALTGGVICLSGQLLLLLNPFSYIWLLICTFIKGTGSIMIYGTMYAMIADVIEYGHWKTGKRVEGVLYTSSSFAMKIGSGWGGALVLYVLAAGGYNGMAAQQTAAALHMIKSLFLYIPLIPLVVVPLLFIPYKVDRLYSRIMTDLVQREEEQARL